MTNRYANISPSRAGLVGQHLGEWIKGRSVVEFGASSGETLRDLYFNFGCEVASYDLYPVDLDFCTSSFFDLDNMKLQEIESTLKSCDVVLFLDVLEHIKNPREVVETILFINPHATIFLISPNFASLRMLLSWIKGYVPDHANGFFDASHIKWLSAKWCFNAFNRHFYDVRVFNIYSEKKPFHFIQTFAPSRMCSQFGAIIKKKKQ